VSAAVVSNGSLDGVGDAGEVSDEVVNGLCGQFGVAGEGGIEVVDVGLVMTVVMDLHGLSVDEGLECGVVVGKGCEFVSHLGFLLQIGL